MNASGPEHATPSLVDGDGVRVVRERRSRWSAATAVKVLAAILVVAGMSALLLSPQTPRTPVARSGDAATPPPNRTPSGIASADTASAASPRVAATAVRAPQRPAAAHAMPSAHNPDPDNPPNGDPNDLATYLSPNEPAPTMAEVIQALHDSGDRTGIGAFNPPGTSPPLVGLAVPADFELPPGYVRHHQVTDEGEVLEAILMFSPDGRFVDASGREMTIPEDRVVPPDMAPPGLTIREITIPPAAQRQP